VPTPPPGSGTIRLVDFAFDPSTITVTAGTTVTWVNAGAALHTVTATDGSWDSGLVRAGGGTFVRRFPTPGTFTYLCSLHPSMTGVVRVGGPNGAPPPPPAPPTPTPPLPPVAGSDYQVRDFAFVPSSIRVTPGSTITWVNTGAAPHTVTDRAGAFDSGILPRGAQFSRTFPTPGTFRLICSIHPEMFATLVVAEPGASAPPPAAPPEVAEPSPGSGDVAIGDFIVQPQALHVAVGTTVHWTNGGVAPHTVTASDGTFDSGFLNHGETFSWTFSEDAVVEYLCAIHPAMVGTVIVGSPGGGASSSGGSAEPGAPTGAGGASASGAPGTSGSAGGGDGAPKLGPATGASDLESAVRLALVGAVTLLAVGALATAVRSSVRPR
jgi:plastocyanin